MANLKSPCLPLFLFFFFFFFLLSSVFSELCNPNDKKVLLKIKKSLNDPYIITSWSPETDCCHWCCVKCDLITHRIISLSISGGELSGQIPPEVGDLPFLENLTFRKLSNLTGPIQPTISKLQNLKLLTLSWTNISGSIPDFLSDLTNLFDLDLSFNNLTGTIPSSLSKLPNLGGLFLDRNKLSGQIPDSFGYFPGNQAPNLHLSHNQLSGKIPVSLSRMDFNIIDFSRNKLEGDVGMIFGENKTTEVVDLSRNELEFDLSKIVFPQSLTSLDLNHNKIYGSIPMEITKLDNLYLNVSYNRLCGQIPVGGRLQSFDVYSYFHNKCLCGSPLAACK